MEQGEIYAGATATAERGEFAVVLDGEFPTDEMAPAAVENAPNSSDPNAFTTMYQQHDNDLYFVSVNPETGMRSETALSDVLTDDFKEAWDTARMAGSTEFEVPDPTLSTPQQEAFVHFTMTPTPDGQVQMNSETVYREVEPETPQEGLLEPESKPKPEFSFLNEPGPLMLEAAPKPEAKAAAPKKRWWEPLQKAMVAPEASRPQNLLDFLEQSAKPEAEPEVQAEKSVVEAMMAPPPPKPEKQPEPEVVEEAKVVEKPKAEIPESAAPESEIKVAKEPVISIDAIAVDPEPATIQEAAPAPEPVPDDPDPSGGITVETPIMLATETTAIVEPTIAQISEATVNEQAIELSTAEVVNEVVEVQAVVKQAETIEAPAVASVETPAIEAVEVPTIQAVETPVAQTVEAPIIETLEVQTIETVEARIELTLDDAASEAVSVEPQVTEVNEAPIAEVAPAEQTVEVPVVMAEEESAEMRPPVQEVEEQAPIAQVEAAPVAQAEEAPTVLEQAPVLEWTEEETPEERLITEAALQETPPVQVHTPEVSTIMRDPVVAEIPAMEEPAATEEPLVQTVTPIAIPVANVTTTPPAATELNDTSYEEHDDGILITAALDENEERRRPMQRAKTHLTVDVPPVAPVTSFAEPAPAADIPFIEEPVVQTIPVQPVPAAAAASTAYEQNADGITITASMDETTERRPILRNNAYMTAEEPDPHTAPKSAPCIELPTYQLEPIPTVDEVNIAEVAAVENTHVELSHPLTKEAPALTPLEEPTLLIEVPPAPESAREDRAYEPIENDSQAETTLPIENTFRKEDEVAQAPVADERESIAADPAASEPVQEVTPAKAISLLDQVDAATETTLQERALPIDNVVLEQLTVSEAPVVDAQTKEPEVAETPQIAELPELAPTINNILAREPSLADTLASLTDEAPTPAAEIQSWIADFGAAEPAAIEPFTREQLRPTPVAAIIDADDSDDITVDVEVEGRRHTARRHSSGRSTRA